MVGHNVWRGSTTELKQPQMCMGAGFLAHSTPELASSPRLRQFHRSDRLLLLAARIRAGLLR